MKILVPGGAGFVGGHLVRALRLAGHDPIVFDLKTGSDLCSSEIPSADVVVHLAALGGVGRAAREPHRIVRSNVFGTAQLVRAMLRWPTFPRIVLVSSFSIYGKNAADVRDTTLPDPSELYGLTKLLQEECFHGTGLAPAIVRCSSIYGRDMHLDDPDATIVARIARWIRDGQRPQLFEDGLQIRDWVSVSDVVAGILRLVDGGIPWPTSPINACSGEGVTLQDACRIVARAMKRTLEPEIVGGSRPGDMRTCRGDATRFAELLGRKPVRFEEGAASAFG